MRILFPHWESVLRVYAGVSGTRVTLMEGYFCATLLNSWRQHLPRQQRSPDMTALMTCSRDSFLELHCIHMVKRYRMNLKAPDDRRQTHCCTLRKSPSLNFMMLALCTAVTFFLLLRNAYPKAYSTVLRDFSCAIKRSLTLDQVNCTLPADCPAAYSRSGITSCSPGIRVLQCAK